MELAAMTQVPDNINPTTVKPMGVSFMWYFLYRFHYTGQRAPANWVPRQSVAATNTEEAPEPHEPGLLAPIEVQL